MAFYDLILGAHFPSINIIIDFEQNTIIMTGNFVHTHTPLYNNYIIITLFIKIQFTFIYK